jgi:regulator of protease activity HflC (stomatin/prohibitin superfamily)
VLDRLVDVLLSFIELFQCWTVIDQYERGVVLRFGKHVRTLQPGFHPVWPMGIEQVLVDNVVPTTTNLSSQSLTTLDGKHVVLSGVVTWSIRHIEKVVLEVEGADEVLADSCYGYIGVMVAASTWEQVRDPVFVEEVTREIRKRAFAYGIEVHRVAFQDMTLCRSVRLWHE